MSSGLWVMTGIGEGTLEAGLGGTIGLGLLGGVGISVTNVPKLCLGEPGGFCVII